MPENIDDAKGQLKENAGKVLGDKDMEAEGKGDQLVGKVKAAADDIIDAVDDVVKGVKNRLS
ncbi:MAG TPA: CsbD family protein [Solirubrobacteraceae bacterium]|nr:CsbD family protein [Solirubrobacteraceae bacterium]